jgi:hypothetical protein
MSNNKEYAVVKIAEKPLSKTPVSSKDGNKASLSPNKQKADLPNEMPSNLEMQPTAHPLIVLVLSCVFSIIFLGRNISKKR